MAKLTSLCMAPGSVVSQPTAVLFGKVAEATVGFHYLRHRSKPFFFPVSFTDFGDFTAGWRNIELYIAFLSTNHPWLVERLLALRRSLKSEKGSLMKIPDLMTSDAELKEFYEIKPNNPEQRMKGLEKLTNIKALLDSVGLRMYNGGTAWKPNKRIQLFEGNLPEIIPNVIVKFKVFFHFEWQPPGLITYEICVELDLALEEMAIRAVAAAIILVVVFSPEILAAVGVGAAELAPILAGGGALIPQLAR